MLGVFAAWALIGFGFPSTAACYAMNVTSKLLAFVTLLTLFLPRRPAAGQAPKVHGSEQAEPAGTR